MADSKRLNTLDTNSATVQAVLERSGMSPLATVRRLRAGGGQSRPLPPLDNNSAAVAAILRRELGKELRDGEMEQILQDTRQTRGTAALSSTAELNEFNRMTGETPRDAVTVMLAAFADQMKEIASGAPGERVVQPLQEQQREQVHAVLRELTDRLVDSALEVGSIEQSERYVRYWKTFCKLLDRPVVMRSAEDANLLAEFASIMGMVWPVQREAGAERGLAPSSVAGAVSAVRVWHLTRHNVNVKLFEGRAARVCKGLKKLQGPQLPMLRLPEKSYRFIVERLRETGDRTSIAHANAISWCFEALFRASEIGDTTGHNRAAGTQRYLLHKNVRRVLGADGRARQLLWTLPKTKWKDTQQNRHLWREGVGASEAEDKELVSTNDFVLQMDEVYKQNEAFLVRFPERRDDLPFVHVNGEPITRVTLQHAIIEGLTAGMPSGACVDPKDYRVGTHTCRKGGATFYYENGIGDKTIMWMGRWSSLGWLVYPGITEKGSRRMAGLMNW